MGIWEPISFGNPQNTVRFISLAVAPVIVVDIAAGRINRRHHMATRWEKVGCHAAINTLFATRDVVYIY
jgi:hypothetical protein